MLSSMAGYDREDPASIEPPYVDYERSSQRATRSFRLGRLFAREKVDSEIAAAVDAAVGVLSKLTAGVREIELPPTPDLFASVADVEAYTFHAARLEKSPELFDPETRKQLFTGAKVTLTEYIQGRRDLDRIRHIIGALFERVDLFVLPTITRPPLRIADCHDAFEMQGGHTGEFNAFGLPTISIPCGFTGTGFPVGLQISGPRTGEAKVIALARTYQRVTNWHLKQPRI
jgi:aspartyl-tRNA(Asn)/glutamyl-tRNA(Gln) amidotransferase subunit A